MPFPRSPHPRACSTARVKTFKATSPAAWAPPVDACAQSMTPALRTHGLARRGALQPLDLEIREGEGTSLSPQGMAELLGPDLDLTDDGRIRVHEGRRIDLGNEVAERVDRHAGEDRPRPAHHRRTHATPPVGLLYAP